MTEITELSVDLIDAPADQPRIDIDAEKLDELCLSIRDHGLINPIQVRPKDGRYELIAGSRRLKCHLLLNLPTIKTIVMQVDEKEADFLRVHENEFRHDLNPIESGLAISRLQAKHKLSVAEIAEHLNKSESYVRTRLDLMSCPEYILEPVAQNKLSVAAALHLNKIEPDEKRRQYVNWAVWRGITASQAAAWLLHSQLGGIVQSAEQLPESAKGSEPVKYKMSAECILCRRIDDVLDLGMFYAHLACYTTFLQKGQAESPNLFPPSPSARSG